MELTKTKYKQSQAGMIPIDWDVFKIQNLIDSGLITGHLDGNHGALYPRSSEFTLSGTPYITANDFLTGKVIFDKVRYLPRSRAEKFQKGIAKDGDVLFAHNATVGPVALLKTNYNYVILSTTATYYRTNSKKLYNKYLRYALESSFFKDQYTSVMGQSTRNQVPITQQRKLDIVLPPTLEEQKAIADALSDTDALIASLEKLIAKKKAIKQGAMQQLLAPPDKGGKRLPGFEGEWHPHKIGEIANTFSGGTPSTSRSEYYGGSIPWISSGELNNLRIKSTSHYITQSGLLNSSAKIVPTGTLLFAMYGATAGVSAVTKIEGAINQAVLAILPTNGFSTEFLFQYLRLHKENIIEKYTQGGQPNLSGHIMRSLKIFFPPTVEEQKSIANTLLDMDREIEKLENKKLKFQQVKQGMMQELLTGRTRLI
jgi:type I restriction enzyme S subunit